VPPTLPRGVPRQCDNTSAVRAVVAVVAAEAALGSIRRFQSFRVSIQMPCHHPARPPPPRQQHRIGLSITMNCHLSFGKRYCQHSGRMWAVHRRTKFKKCSPPPKYTVTGGANNKQQTPGEDTGRKMRRSSEDKHHCRFKKRRNCSWTQFTRKWKVSARRSPNHHPTEEQTDRLVRRATLAQRYGALPGGLLPVLLGGTGESKKWR
jgi:hypothetical protein